MKKPNAKSQHPITVATPVYLAKNDPEMFDFIYSVVRRK
jgi:hypothetical protein